jgi:hypothetical protein
LTALEQALIGGFLGELSYRLPLLFPLRSLCLGELRLC